LHRGHILIVDDERSILTSLEGILRDEGFKVSQATSGPQALDIIMKELPDLALLDIWLPGMDDIELLKLAKSIYPELVVIMMSGHGNIDTAVKATKLGAFDFIEKPLSLDNVIQVVNQALTQKRTWGYTGSIRQVSGDRGELIGQSKAIQDLRRVLPTLTRDFFPLILVGEEGSGKEFVARLLHAALSYPESTFVRISCPELVNRPLDPSRLTEVQTIFLHQWALLSNAEQRKLLGLLLEIWTNPRHPVVIISSTSLPGAEIQGALQARFVPRIITLPPLRERKEDIPLLLNHFIEQFSLSLGLPPKEISREALTKLKEYNWPGNVKELKNVVLRMVSSTPKQVIELQDLPTFIVQWNLDLEPGRKKRCLSQRRRSQPLQKTLKKSVVLCGQGLHSGSKGGLILFPAPPNTGITFCHISSGEYIPAQLDLVSSTCNAIVLKKGGVSIRTIEHLMAALHAYGISNALIKIGDEVPIMDGSAREFCQLIEEGGIEEQELVEEELVIDDRLVIGDPPEGKYISIEPHPNLTIHYIMEYPPPIGHQEYLYVHEGGEGFKELIAPARTFVFLKEVEYLEEKGLTRGGKLSNVILLDQGRVINTPLRFEDEYPRHKILDIMGDLYLLGRKIRGLVTARMSGHTENIELLKRIKDRFL